MNKYQEYGAEDFVYDDSFKHWVLSGKQEDDLFWDQWIAKNPGKEKDVNEAIGMIEFLGNLPDQRISADNEVWSNIQSGIHKPSIRRNQQAGLLTRNAFLRIAAVFIGFILIAGAGWFVFRSIAHQEFVTDYGQTRSFYLPDNTLVHLNANSSLSFNKFQWKKESARRVQLSGEAFLHVKKMNGLKFTVQTKDINVEVLGTEFAVKSREENTSVVLKSGKVKLKTTHSENPSQYVMSPNELVEYSEAESEFARSRVDVDRYLAWRSDRFIFNNTTLGEIAQLIRENFGFDVIFSDESMKDRKLTGEMTSKDLDVLLNVISYTFKIKVTKEGNKIILQKTNT